MGTKSGTIGAKTAENDPNVPKTGTIGARREGRGEDFGRGSGILGVGGGFWVGEGLFFQKI
jgi:hypothetical protein